MYSETDDALKLQHPCTVLISAPTMSGKSMLNYRFLQENMFNPAPDEIIYFYGVWQPLFDEMQNTTPNITFVEGIDADKIHNFDPNLRRIAIFDDLLTSATKSQVISDLFTRGCHHTNTSIVLITQNLFPKGSHARTISLNCQYIIVMKNARDQQQINILGRQMFSRCWFIF